MLKQIFIFIVVGHRFAFSPCDLFDWHRSTFELSTKYYSFFFGRFSRQSFFQYRRYHITKMQSISEADVENNTDGMLKRWKYLVCLVINSNNFVGRRESDIKPKRRSEIQRREKGLKGVYMDEALAKTSK